MAQLVRAPMFVAMILACCLSPERLRAQETVVRFEIADVADSTFTIHSGRFKWIRVGQHGVVVDPRERDVLVARFLVIQADSLHATGLVTGLTTKLSQDHMVLLEPPLPLAAPWYRRKSFLVGLLLGAAAGFGAGAASR